MMKKVVLPIVAALAVFPMQAAAAVPSKPPFLVGSFGADLTGGKDATGALNACLTAAAGAGGGGGVCMVDQLATLKLLGNVIIPQHTAIDCQLEGGTGGSLSGQGPRCCSMRDTRLSPGANGRPSGIA
jgi:hypothetical protein